LDKGDLLLTPRKDSPMTPTSDKQILGFTFQRKQTCRLPPCLDAHSLPIFHLSTEEMNVYEHADEFNEEMVDS